jgi:hypothetical protein
MPQSTISKFLIRGTALAALFAISVTTRAQNYGTAPMNRGPAQGGPAIQLLNDPQTNGNVVFLLDGQEQTLQPGQSLDLDGSRPHQVEFNTGGSYGDVRFTLYQGLYKFKVMPEGWALFKSSSSPSVASGVPTPGVRTQVQRGYTPPLPAEDLRTRRVANRGAATGETQADRAANPPQPPSAGLGTGQDNSGGIAAPPAPGVTRQRTNAPRTP